MRSTVVLPGLLVTAALLAGCKGEKADEPPLRAEEPVRAGDRYVAMGDSYTAAPRIGPTDDESTGCTQSTNNYPHLLAAELDLELEDVSCGGAITASIEQGQVTYKNAQLDPQIDALTEATDLVTISIGANDERIYGDLIRFCVQRATDPEGAPCTEADAAGGELSVEARIDRMEERIVDVLAGITAEAPEARVVFVGYPQFAPDERCAQFPIGAGDVEFAQRVNELLVLAQERAAAEAGVEFLDLYELTEGHHFCADDPWVAGLHPTAPAITYHPYLKEQQVAAEALAELVS
ncbi:lysophospholipase L1-like esterase [Nocardioides thalensis]|uniref:Lysophospholipase L1-like esterase n=1 Tax=Nocardioides thalensis TaxID=1914755 RepID=A0A853C766_9ACTN|nr:SGNH/GDSL hydrolase family protein [Nocardioides thalensis]NYJ03079.1 lysophospholipase L1-like esterase [Nocardioides thalensis]